MTLVIWVQWVLDADFSEQSSRVRMVASADNFPGEFDANRVRLLVRNLVENALRYNPEDGEPVQVSPG